MNGTEILSSQRLPCTGYVLGGAEEDEETVALSEFERIGAELRQSEQRQPPKQSNVYTLYLFPRQPDARAPHASREASADLRIDPWALNPVMIHLPWDNKELLKQRVKEEVDGAYMAGGSEALTYFLPSVDFTNKVYAEETGWSRNAVRFKSESDAARACRMVRDACAEAKEDLDKRVDEAVKAVEAAAATEAVGRLTQAREEILREALRYFSGMREPANQRASLFDETSRDPNLRGKDIGNLLLALRDLHQIRKSIDDAERELSDKTLEILALLGPEAPPWMLAGADREAAARNPDLAEQLRRATDGLALALTVYGRRFPILFRIWNMAELSADLRPHRFGGLDAKTNEGWQAHMRLSHTIVTALNAAWASNTELLAQLESEPALVWRFPSVVTAALASTERSSPRVDTQAAQERMAEEGESSWAAKAAMVSGALELLAALTSAAPPIAITLATISFVLGGIDNILEYLELRTEDAAFQATLDPSKALASEPDYTGLLVGVAFSMLDLKGVRDEIAAGATREARRLAETAANGVAP
jgi:hypothetical protein